MISPIYSTVDSALQDEMAVNRTNKVMGSLDDSWVYHVQARQPCKHPSFNGCSMDVPVLCSLDVLIYVLTSSLKHILTRP